MNKDDIQELIEEISRKQPVFENERDFQYHLAHEIERRYPKCVLYLEGRPLRIHEDLNYDIVMLNKDIETFIELKYKTTKLDVKVDSKRFQLKNQSAQDLSSYDFFYDLWKLEQTLSSSNVVGFAIFLTNDSLYWRGSEKFSDYYPFRLEDKRVVQGGKNHSWLKNKEKKGKNRQMDIRLKQNYRFDWRDYATVKKEEQTKNTKFKYLLVEVGIP